MNKHPASQLIRIDWKPIILWGGGSGAAVGLWWGLWFTGFLLMWDRGWFFQGIAIPVEDPRFLLVSTKQSLGWLAFLLGCPPPGSLSSVLLWIVAAGAVIGAAIASLGRLFGIDPNQKALRSFLWSIRAMASPVVAAATIALVGSFSIFFAFESTLPDGWIFWFVVVGCLAVFWLAFWLVGIPLLVCRSDVAGKTSTPWWWRPRWPGWKPVAFVFGVAVLVYGPGFLLDWAAGFDTRPGIVLTVWLADLAWSVVIFVSPLVVCAKLMESSEPVSGLWRRFFRWAFLGPWIALHGWWTVVILVFMPPILAVYVWLLKVVPVWATVLESQGEFFPYYCGLFVNTTRVIGNFWWLLFSIPVMFFFWFGVARLSVLMEEFDKAEGH